jgi:Putative peptidoglycan binding domain
MTDTALPGRSRRLARRVAVVLALVLFGACAVAIGYAVQARPRASDQPSRPAQPRLVTVTRGTAAERIQVTGTLGFAGSHSVLYQGPPGILTSTADLNTTVQPGGILCTVANLPVRLLLGKIPAYRELGAGVPDGPDVRQLEQNLVDLGMDPGHHVAVDNHWSPATTDAIRRWQASWGWPASARTGRLPLGVVAFAPNPLRIGRIDAAVGSSVGSDTVILTGTSTNRVVTAMVTADRQGLVHPGDQVIVSIPGSAPLPGTVTAIGSPTAPSPGPDAANTPPTVPVTITVVLPSGAPQFDAAPVQVAITTAAHPNVLLVPISALLARPGGGYQVRLESGGYVQVQPGLFDDSAGLVEVQGAGLSVGVRVEVPSA